MADYVVNNGNIQMMIRDTGGWVEYWVKTDQYTYNHQQQWSGTGFGVSTFDMNNRGSWQYINHVYIGGSQNVSFTMYNASLGFPTYTETVWISRATVPPPPTPVYFQYLTNTTVRALFGGQGDGGSAVDAWQLAYGTDPNTAQYYIGSGGLNDISGLTPGYVYYFWARGHNALGWGPWSSRTAVQMQNVPDPPTVVTLTNVLQNSLHASFRGGYDGGTPVDQWQLAYGKDPNTPQATVTGGDANDGEVDLTGLDPGQLYYFWARGHNQWGWGPYSARTQALLVAGAFIPVDGVQRRAVPYVKDGGVWKLARSWGKSGGTWRPTSS